MFGCCVAGRVLQTNLQQIDETHALFELTHASSINHVCVFLLGTVPFPDGYGATVHFFWPGKGFQLLGMLSNEKPSAIFRLRGTFTSTSTSTSTLQNAFTSSSSTSSNPTTTIINDNDVTAILGLSIEPLDQIHNQITSLTHTLALTQNKTQDPTFLADRIVNHLFNYISSFVGGAVTSDIAVPMNVIAKWYESFLGKVKAGGVGFLERGD